MKQRCLLLIPALLIFALSLKAQNCDPWIVQAYKQLYGRNPNSTECNIYNYNNGHWNSYCELLGYIENYNRYKSGNFLKGDPWIFQAYCEMYNRNPTAMELNIKLYNAGSWNSYSELKNYIKQYQSALSNNGVKVLTGKANGKDAVVMLDNNNKVLAVSLLSLTGGNVIAAGGGNVIAAGGGNVIAAGGGNFTFSSNTAGLNVGNVYTVQSVGTKVIKTSGKGALVIR